MKNKKIKRINVRISLEFYEFLKTVYKYNTNIYKSFSAYIRHLIELGLTDKNY